MVIQMSCVWLNCYSALHTQTQKQMETEGYRMHGGCKEGHPFPLRLSIHV